MSKTIQIKENRLAKEKSPYLLQHAKNPVDWYPWGEEAFEKAKREDKPIFLSIGYSTCHWCHVMERESFEDEEVAELLNRNFVSIKVDREERPDVDAIYMAVCQAITGSGGWPLTILMTHEQKPFYAGTYFPKYQKYGQVGLMALLSDIANLWKKERNKLLEAGEGIASFIAKQASSYKSPNMPSKEILLKGKEQFRQMYDENYGGFGIAPKFPAPHNLLFLLSFGKLEKDSEAFQMVEKTLESMYRGGIFDHIGGGFSRYATDERWLIPHFEKMLYDNALLATLYLEAFRVTEKPYYERVARRTLDYILRELTHENGGFYCGQDADSEGVEGKYYVFVPEEVTNVLGKEDGAVFCDWFGITEEGDFEGKNIPNLLENEEYQSFPSQIQELCKKIYEYRLSRTKLHKDDKILNAWNSLAIVAFSKAFQILGDSHYLSAAKKSAAFIKKNLMTESGRLLVRWRESEAAHRGKLEDYAFYIDGLLQLYEASYEARYLIEAVEVAHHMIDLFFDQEQSGFYLYSSEESPLISRPKEFYDGAMPSGNSVAGKVLMELAKITGEMYWQEIADKQLAFLAGNILEYPVSHSVSLLAMIEALYPSVQLICVCSEEIPSEKIHDFVNRCNLPITLLVKTKENQEVLGNIAPFTNEYSIPQQGEAYYLCKNGSCLAPVTILEELEQYCK